MTSLYYYCFELFQSWLYPWQLCKPCLYPVEREREGYIHGQSREWWKHYEHIGWLHYTLGYGVQNNSSEAICVGPKRYSMGMFTCCSKNFTCRNQGPFFLTKSFHIILGYLYILLGFSFGSIALGHLMGTKHWFWRSFYLQLSIFSAVVSIGNRGEIETICIWWTRYLSLGVVNNELIWNP